MRSLPERSSAVGVAGTLSAWTLVLCACLSFITASAAEPPPGVRPCFTNDVPAGYGTFLFLKNVTFHQGGAGAPVETNSPAASAAFEIASPGIFGISNAVVSGPGNYQAPLILSAGGSSAGGTSYTNAAGLNAAILPGAWNTRFQVLFTNSEPFVGFFPFLVASNVPPIPQVANLQAGQAINPGASFTLSWTPWIGSATNDRISLVLTDSAGQVVVSAATDCAGAISLPTGATSVDIPAGSLAGGTTYTAYLTFGGSLVSAQDDSALQVIRGFHSHTTKFNLRTTGSSGGEPGSFSTPRVSGTNLVFTLTGAAGAIYQIQSSTNFVAWTDEQAVTIPPSGQAEVTIPLPADGLARFYRAFTTGGGEPPVGDATLGVGLEGANQLVITLTGTAGTTYTLEFSTNYTTWNAVQEVPIPAGTNSVTIRITIATGIPFVVYRASSAGVIPPVGDGPALTLASDGAGFRVSLSDGGAQKTYILQKAGATLTGWTDTTQTFTTDAAGAGSVTVTPVVGESAAFYRALSR